jgi:hypothetical protein
MDSSNLNVNKEKKAPYVAKVFLEKLEEIKKDAVVASLKECFPIPLTEMGIDADLTGKELYVTEIDKYYGIGGSLSRVHVMVEFFEGYECLHDYFIPTNYLLFK